ncbi:MAG: metal ABC transporter permease [Anaerolineae bacterium]|nr:metal ABC transporter permease [Candidatus Roseilinea sp.]MDW8449522.1 metal ABC transporter permease [Anaerolineae bacterium]
MSASLAIILTGVLVATACALLGVFLVLRRMAMLADAISHAILPGIVAGYFLAQGPNLLAGFAGASLAAVITVALVEALQNTRRVGGESAIGIVFPAMFALGTFLVSKYFANVHLDTDAVLYGNIEFAAFDVLFVNDVNLGPQSLWVMGALCIINLLFVGLFFKELKLATFDPGLAAALGFSPVLIHYALMAVVSITTVGAFTAVGAILVVAFMIVPAATAYLLTDDLSRMIVLAVVAGAASAVAGFFIALALDASVAGAMATMTGAFFLLALLFSPSHGLVAKARRLQRQRMRVAMENLVVHLFNHEHQAYEEHEAEVAHLSSELRWQPGFARQVIGMAKRAQLVQQANGHLMLTGTGRELAQRASALRDGEG